MADIDLKMVIHVVDRATKPMRKVAGAYRSPAQAFALMLHEFS